MAPGGLPLGAVIGQAAANINYRLRLRQLTLPAATKEEALAAARRHLNFPLYVATKDFVNSFSANMPFLWAAVYFDRAEIGLFGLAVTFVLQPARLVCSAFERVFYARGAELVRSRQPLMPMVSRFTAVALSVALPVCVAAWFLAGPLFSFGFGSRWQGCGAYVQTLLPWVLFMLTANSLMFVSNLFSTQRTEFLFHIVQLVLRIGALAAGIAAGDFKLAAWLFSGVSALTCLALTAWYLWQVMRYERSLKA